MAEDEIMPVDKGEELVLAVFGGDVYHLLRDEYFSFCARAWLGRRRSGAIKTWSVWKRKWAEEEGLRECKDCPKYMDTDSE
ncbi:MAG: hypothetical protein R3346_03635 [Candidatus Spechtbacterales bacterium]|nr:hypothetical protein [Candidatus Spechtbacterales bacterium]